MKQTLKEQNWEKEFDDQTWQWHDESCIEESSEIYWDKIKDFIRTLLKEEKKKWIEEMFPKNTECNTKGKVYKKLKE